jgi:hypothetical protein
MHRSPDNRRECLPELRGGGKHVERLAVLRDGGEFALPDGLPIPRQGGEVGFRPGVLPHCTSPAPPLRCTIGSDGKRAIVKA